MIEDAIERIEKNKGIEETALSLHVPGNGIYIVVEENLKDYKILSKEQFGFNSKYALMDYYSRIISVNKSVDTKKKIFSNNYLSFFCRNIDALTEEIIDNYYKRLDAPKKYLEYKKWIIENINKINKKDKNDIIKIFFKADIQEYIDCGRRYFLEKSLSNIIINGEELGTTLLINLNTKKPFLQTKSRKTDYPELVNREYAYKVKCFLDILYTLIANNKDAVYILDDGQIVPVSIRKGETPHMNIKAAILIVFQIGDRGNIEIVNMDTISNYMYYL